MQTVSGPAFYETNKVPPESGFGAFSMSTVPDDVRERFLLKAINLGFDVGKLEWM